MPRKSINAYNQFCPGFPIPGRRPLRVPVTFDYRVMRDHFGYIVNWVVSRIAHRTLSSVSGPIICYNMSLRGPLTIKNIYGEEETNGVYEVHKFLNRVMNINDESRRIGVAFLSKPFDGTRIEKESGHRSVILVDATELNHIVLHVIDPNGETQRDEFVRRYLRNRLCKLFDNGLGYDIEIHFTIIPKINVSSLTYNRNFDVFLGIRDNIEPGAYCVYGSLLVAIDVMCTHKYSLRSNHFERMVNDMSGVYPALTPDMVKFNRLMAMRSFTFELLSFMSVEGVWPPDFVDRKNPRYRIPTNIIEYDPMLEIKYPPPPPLHPPPH